MKITAMLFVTCLACGCNDGIIDPYDFNTVNFSDDETSIARAAIDEWCTATNDCATMSNAARTLSRIEISGALDDTNSAGKCESASTCDSHDVSTQSGIVIYVKDQRAHDDWLAIFYHVVLHELGHAFGRGHSQNKDDVMAPMMNATQHLTQGDVSLRACRYE